MNLFWTDPCRKNSCNLLFISSNAASQFPDVVRYIFPRHWLSDMAENNYSLFDYGISPKSANHNGKKKKKNRENKAWHCSRWHLFCIIFQRKWNLAFHVNHLLVTVYMKCQVIIIKKNRMLSATIFTKKQMINEYFFYIKKKIIENKAWHIIQSIMDNKPDMSFKASLYLSVICCCLNSAS